MSCGTPASRALSITFSAWRTSPIEGLCARAGELEDEADARAALLTWLSDLIASSVRSRGLAAALAHDGGLDASSCAVALETAVAPLLNRAIAAHAVAAHVTVTDLLTLIVGIVLSTEHHADQAVEAERMFRLTVAGLSPER
jgi:hypothetical protein